MGDRSSEASEPALITDRKKLARKEAENSVRQVDATLNLIDSWITEGTSRLRPSVLLNLNRIVLQGTSKYPGTYRPDFVKITGSRHQPPAAELVPALVDDLCDYITENWNEFSAIHLAAYTLWRVNWIHPFVDGNGRTARAISYLVLCARLGYRLPGTRTIPDHIAENMNPYYVALEAADLAAKNSKIDVSETERLIEGHLAAQLVDVHKEATTGNANRFGGGVADVVRSGGGDVQSTAALPSWRRTRLLRLVESHPVISGGVFLVVATLLAALLG